MGLEDKTNWTDLTAELEIQALLDYKAKAVTYLTVVGERCVKYARDDMSAARHFTDRTGNLRNSIGYIVVQDGRVKLDSFAGNTPPSEGNKGDASMAHQKGLSYAEQVARTYSPDKTYLIVVAGMEYAVCVEAKGFDVITGTHDWVESNVTKFRAEFKRYLQSKVR